MPAILESKRRQEALRQLSEATASMLPHIDADDRKRIIDDIYRRAGIQRMKQVKFSREKMNQLHILTAQIRGGKKGGR